MSRHPVLGPANTVGWPRERVGSRVGDSAGHACCSERVTRWHPRRGGRSFELSASAAPATLSSSLEVGCRGGGAGASSPRAEPLAPPSCSGLCLVSTWLPEAVTDRQPDARPGRRQNGGVRSRPWWGIGGKECGSGKKEA